MLPSDATMQNTAETTGLSTPQLSPLAQALTTHEKRHSNLADALSELEHKLGSVLRPTEPSDKNPAGIDEKLPTSELTNAVNDSNQRLHRYTARIHALLERLEV